MKVFNRHSDNKPHFTLLDFFGWVMILLACGFVSALGLFVYKALEWLSSF